MGRAHGGRWLPSFLVIVALVAVTACGSDTGSTTTAPATPTSATVETTEAAEVTTTVAGDTEAPTETTEADDIDEVITVRLAGIEAGVSGLIPSVIDVAGLDEANGLNLEITHLPLAEAVRSVILGQQDAGVIAVIPIPNALAGGSPDLRVIAPMYWMHGSLLVNPDSPYETLEDLRGERIAGFAPSSATQNAFELLATELGFNVAEDFEILQGNPVVNLEAVRSGDAAAALVFPPLTAQVVHRGEFRELLFVNDGWRELTGNNMISGGFGALQGWIDENPEAVARLQQAIADGIRYILDNPDIYEDPEIKRVLGLEESDADEIDAVREAINAVLIPPEEWDEAVVDAQIDVIVSGIVAGQLSEVSRGLLEQAMAPSISYGDR